MVEIEELREVLYDEESKIRWKEIHKSQKAITEKREKRIQYLESVGRTHLISKSRYWPPLPTIEALRVHEGFVDRKGITESQVRMLFFYQKSRAVIHHLIMVIGFFFLLAISQY